MLTGCSDPQRAEPEAPKVFALDRASYDATFDAAVKLVADEGMPAVLRDRDAGIIESRPNVSGSLLEPWDWPGGNVASATESTLGYQRRRVRFEFVPAGFRPRDLNEDAPLEGVRTPGSVEPDASGAVNFNDSMGGSMGTYEGPIELRVWVYVERAYTPYLQRSTWTFQNRSFARNPERQAAVDDGTTRDRSIWTPVARDPAMEEVILAKLRDRIG